METKNPLRLYLNILYKQLSIINELNYFIHTNMQRHIKRFKESGKEERNQAFSGTTLVYRDLIELLGTRSFAVPKFIGPYLLHGENFHEVYMTIVEKEGGFSVSQAYEAFETFLINILSYLVFNHQKYLDPKIATKYMKGENKKLIEPESYRDFIKYGYRDNNKKIKFLRKNFNFIENCEKSNYKNINLQNWFIVFSKVRHAVIHSDYMIKPKGLSRFSKANEEILNIYFPGTLRGNGFYLLKIDRKSVEVNFHILCDYAFLLIKSISIEFGFDHSNLVK